MGLGLSATPLESTDDEFHILTKQLAKVGEVNIFLMNIVGLGIHKLAYSMATKAGLGRPTGPANHTESLQKLELDLMRIQEINKRERAYEGLHVPLRALTTTDNNKAVCVFSLSIVEEHEAALYMLQQERDTSVQALYSTQISVMQQLVRMHRSIFVYIRPTERATLQPYTNAYLTHMDRAFYSAKLCDFAYSYHTMVVQVHSCDFTSDAMILAIFRLVVRRVLALNNRRLWGDSVRDEVFKTIDYQEERIVQAIV
jgi:hypothetical protein